MTPRLLNWRPSGRALVFTGIAGAGLLFAAWQPGEAQVRRDVDPDRPPVVPPADPVDEPRLRRGLAPETDTPATDSPATRPATLMTFTGKVGLVEPDDDKLTILIDDTEEKTFTIADDAKITLNSKPARLKDVLAGDIVKIVAHKSEPSLAQSIVAARVTEYTDKEPSARTTRRDSESGEYGTNGRDNQGDASATAVAGQGGGAAGMVVPFNGRVFVMQVVDGSPAAQLGLQPGDSILIVGRNNLIPSNANIDGGAGINGANLQNGLVVLPDGTLGFNRGGARGAVGTGTGGVGTFVPGSGVLVPGAGNTGVGNNRGVDDGTGNNTGTNNGTGVNQGTGNNRGTGVNQGTGNNRGTGVNRGTGNNRGTGTNRSGAGAPGGRTNSGGAATNPVTPGGGAAAGGTRNR